MTKFKKGDPRTIEMAKRSDRTGTPNKATTEVRKAFQLLVENNLQQMQADLDSLEPKDRLSVIIQLAKFVLPQLQAVSVEDVTAKPPVIIEYKTYQRQDGTEIETVRV